MPTYEYACRSCGDEFEVVQSFTDPPRTECTVCGGALRKVFSPVGIAFKGTGFYKTDSRSGSGTGRARKAGAGDGESPKGDKAGAKSEGATKADGGGSSPTATSTAASSAKAAAST